MSLLLFALLFKGIAGEILLSLGNKRLHLEQESPSSLPVPPQVPVECFLPPDSGHCSQDLIRIYYDAETRTCKPFSYTGCAGNPNRFVSIKNCYRVCHPFNFDDSIKWKLKQNNIESRQNPVLPPALFPVERIKPTQSPFEQSRVTFPLPKVSLKAQIRPNFVLPVTTTTTTPPLPPLDSWFDGKNNCKQVPGTFMEDTVCVEERILTPAYKNYPLIQGKPALVYQLPTISGRQFGQYSNQVFGDVRNPFNFEPIKSFGNPADFGGVKGGSSYGSINPVKSFPAIFNPVKGQSYAEPVFETIRVPPTLFTETTTPTTTTLGAVGSNSHYFPQEEFEGRSLKKEEMVLIPVQSYFRVPVVRSLPVLKKGFIAVPRKLASDARRALASRDKLNLVES